MGSVPAHPLHQLIHDPRRLGAQPASGRLLLQLGQVVPHLGFRLSGVLGSVFAVRLGAEEVRYFAQDLDLLLDSAGYATQLPVRLERLGQSVQPGRLPVFFFEASKAAWRTCSSRW